MSDRAIIFDVDGVLNEAYNAKDDSDLLDMDRVKLLVDTAKKVQAELVLSSTWGMDNGLVQKVVIALGTWGSTLYGNVHLNKEGILLAHDVFPDKDVRVLNWLANHPEIKKYVVLDDWDYSETFGNSFIRTWAKNRYGLDTEFCTEIVKKFDEN